MKKILFSSLALAILSIAGLAIANATPSPIQLNEEETLVDLTSKITNPQFDNGTTGWTVNTGKIEVKATSTGNPVVTAYNYQVDISQNITDLTPGTYILKVQACSRHKDGKTGITEYESGTEIPNEAYIYAKGQQQKIKNIYEETSTYDFATESGHTASDITMSNGQQIPYNSTNFARAFGEFGMYENQLEFTVGTDGVATIGIKNELKGSSYKPYIAYDNFRLYRVGGGETPDPPTPPTPVDPSKPELYDLHAEAGTFVPVCMPYAVKSEYFGQVYTIGSIQDGEAIIVPVDEVATGVPCVVKSKGSSSVKQGDVTLNYNTKPTTYSLWDNTSLTVKDNFDGFTWTATDIYNNAIDVAGLTYIEGDLSDLEFTASIENNAVARFWAQNPTYLAETPSTVGNYLKMDSYVRTDKPNPVLVPVFVSTASQTVSYWRKADKSDIQTVTVAKNTNVAEIYDLIPGTTYSYESNYGGAKGKFTVGGALRMMYIGENVVNMRDLGGKQGKDGKYVRYGKLFRSAQLNGCSWNKDFMNNDEERQKLVDFGVDAQIDLRNTDGGISFAWLPNAKEGTNFFYAKNGSVTANGPAMLYDGTTIKLLKAEFEFLVKNLKRGVSVQFHCRIGADRTGLFAFILQGILGVSESDILREYELTSFSQAGLRTKAQGDDTGGNYEADLPKFKAKAPQGSTFLQVFEDYFLNTLKVSQADIDDFRSIMLGDTPLPADIEAEEAVTVSITKAGVATMYYGHKNLVVPEGVEALTYTNNGDAVIEATVTYKTGDVIPAGTAVVLHATETLTKTKDFTFYVSVSKGEKPAGNILKGTDEQKEVTAAEGKYIYRLLDGSHGVGFYRSVEGDGSTFTNGAHKAYMEIAYNAGSGTQKAPLFISPLPGGVITVVDDLNVEPVKTGIMYNVMGQPVDASYKGIVIMDGKKFINR